MSDPFDPLSPGLHRTDGGLGYQATAPGQPAGDVDFLFGRELDVMLLPFGYQPGPGAQLWAAVLVELNLSMPELSVDDAAGGRVRVVGDMIGDVLRHRGMLPVAGLDVEPPEPDGPIRWTVRTETRGHRPAGVYAPGAGGLPSGWVVGSPLPRRPPRWGQAVADRGGRCQAFVTTHTAGIVYEHGDGFIDAMNAEGARGRLWAATAAVLGPLR